MGFDRDLHHGVVHYGIQVRRRVYVFAAVPSSSLPYGATPHADVARVQLLVRWFPLPLSSVVLMNSIVGAPVSQLMS